ncbi:MAG: hypothetical protein KAH57_10430 [Thermoplasmata archaeon]|nr:hypothetical protein [Thermoplasmata archaeon]
MEAIKKLLLYKLDIGKGARFQFNRKLSNEYPVPSNLIIESTEKTVFVEIVHTTSWKNLSNLLLLENLNNTPSRLVIISRIFPDHIRRSAKILKIELIPLPEDVLVIKNDKRPSGKITSEKAWRIILALMRLGPCSIRRISVSENISYGWTYGVIGNLISRNIVDRINNKVEITNTKDLFNAVAWERPFKELEKLQIRTSFESSHDLSRTLTSWAHDRGDLLVMCGYSAASIQYGYGVRNDLIQCYVPDDGTLKALEREFSVDDTDGVTIIVFKPDRNVSDSAVIVDEVLVTNRYQTLLDVAGMGFSGYDLLDSMVREYGTDSP